MKSEKQKALIEAKANILKALGHPTRLWMTEQLGNGEKCVQELAQYVDADVSTISKHLSILKQAGIVRDEKRGKMVYYHLKITCILEYIRCIENVLQTQINENIDLLK